MRVLEGMVLDLLSPGSVVMLRVHGGDEIRFTKAADCGSSNGIEGKRQLERQVRLLVLVLMLMLKD